MTDLGTRDERPVELGRASVETRGSAIFEVDLSTGPARYVSGAAGE